jgi:hypothetical protein
MTPDDIQMRERIDAVRAARREREEAMTSDDIMHVHELMSGSDSITMVTSKGLTLLGDRESSVISMARALQQEDFARIIWGALIMNGHTTNAFPGGSEVDK